MKKDSISVSIVRCMFLLIAFASILSMAINTGSFEIFLRYFSISSNMIIVFCMIYLSLFFSKFQELKEKRLVIMMLWGVALYLILWNGLPFIFWMFQNGFTQSLIDSQMSAIPFIVMNILQIVIVPLLLFFLLRFEVNSVFKKKHYHLWLHLIILWTIFWGVVYLVIAAM